MKKIGVLMALMLVVIVFCGKKNEIDKILPSGGKKAAQSKELIQQNLNSYNKNIKIYNRILELDKELLYYFEDTGTEETFKKPVQEMTVNIPLNQALIDRIKEVSKSPKPTELDKKAGEMIPVLEEMLPVITEMNNYYGGKLYQKDNYKKAYYLAQIGDYADSYSLYTEILSVAKQEEKWDIYYFTQINRQYLFSIIKQMIQLTTGFQGTINFGKNLELFYDDFLNKLFLSLSLELLSKE